MPPVTLETASRRVPEAVGRLWARSSRTWSRRRSSIAWSSAAAASVAVAVWIGRVAGLDRGAAGIGPAAWGAPLLGLLAFVSPAGMTLPCWASIHPRGAPGNVRAGRFAPAIDWLRTRF